MILLNSFEICWVGLRVILSKACPSLWITGWLLCLTKTFRAEPVVLLNKYHVWCLSMLNVFFLKSRFTDMYIYVKCMQILCHRRVSKLKRLQKTSPKKASERFSIQASRVGHAMRCKEGVLWITVNASNQWSNCKSKQRNVLLEQADCA